MGFATIAQLAALIATSFIVAMSVLYTLGWIDRRFRPDPAGILDENDGDIVFLFDEEVLLNATPRARNMVSSGQESGSDWTRLTSVLVPHFPELCEEISTLAERGSIVLSATVGGAQLKAQWLNGLARVSLFGFGDEDQDMKLDQPSFSAMRQELETLRSTAATAPFLVWRQNRNGAISWANKSYLALSQIPKPIDGIATWPPRRLFTLSNTVPAPPKSMSQRISTTIPGEVEPRWFECFETPLGEDSLFTAVAADKVVRAEKALNEFVQTLTKTFAHLKTGLAIFDKQRRLALFNPALVDLTSLKPEFLTGQPTLHAVLDKLREKQVLPEPKDYKSWRRQIYDLEVAAVNGTYEETWSLPNGRTYRVTGQPHPDGALAFLMEDISAEISLTRQFRAELDVSQAVLDSFAEAIAVFSPTGALTITNTAYSRLWGLDNDNILTIPDIVAATKGWAEQCAPSPVWGDAREFIGTLESRAEWLADIMLLDGRSVSCRFSPISGGATLIGFSVLTAIDANPATSDDLVDSKAQIDTVTA